MSDKSSIEWTDATWNPIRGTAGRHHCVRISEGCKHCYASTMNHRFGGPDYVKGADTPRLDEDALLQPLKWKKARRIFVCSMTDLFMDEHFFDAIDLVFAVMAVSPQHTFQVLTKRSRRMQEYILSRSLPGASRVALSMALSRVKGNFPHRLDVPFEWPLPNVWLGVSCENQERADERIPDLLATPAAVRFVSAEPLLGPINLAYTLFNGADSFGSMPGLHWVIVGGESGPGARPCDVSWIRSIKDQCLCAGVPVFVKQLGVGHSMHTAIGRGNHHSDYGSYFITKDRKGGDPAEWPADLRVRQMPDGRNQ